jgi:tellurite resistance protein
MPETAIDDVDDVQRSDPQGGSEQVVEEERAKLKEFVAGLRPDDIKSGGWFTKLIGHALTSYSEKANWEYFQDRYEGVPAHGIVDQRIKMASRYAAIEGGLSAGAYTAAVAGTIGTLGGASVVTIPAAVATVMVDVAFITQLQLRLAYDIAVLYRVPLNLSDPEDLWKLIRVAFTIKGGEIAREGVIKVVPAMMRPIIKTFYKGPFLAAARGLPFVGKFLLQRNIIKIGIPAVGVPLAVLLNRYTTLVAGKHAPSVFGNEARVIEAAKTLSHRSRHPRSMLWVAWLVVMADKKVSDDEALLMRHLVRAVREQHQIVDEQLSELVDIDPGDVWLRLADESGDLGDVLDAATRVATIDGPENLHERRVLNELRERLARP